MIVPQRDVQGGIASVTSGYYGSRLETDFDVIYVESYRDGSKWQKLLKALAAYRQFRKVLRKVKPDLIHIHSSFGPSFYRKMPFILGLLKDTGGSRHTVTYCQYGERRQKPTDIFTNHPYPQFRPPCKRGAPCHDAAPRGSRTGTQGLKGKAVRAKLPAELCRHIVAICETIYS